MKFLVGSAAVVVILGLFMLGVLAGGWLWPYTIETWANAFGHGEGIDVPFLVGVLLGLIPITGPLTIPFAVITWAVDVIGFI